MCPWGAKPRWALNRINFSIHETYGKNDLPVKCPLALFRGKTVVLPYVTKKSCIDQIWKSNARILGLTSYSKDYSIKDSLEHKKYNYYFAGKHKYCLMLQKIMYWPNMKIKCTSHGTDIILKGFMKRRKKTTSRLSAHWHYFAGRQY